MPNFNIYLVEEIEWDVEIEAINQKEAIEKFFEEIQAGEHETVDARIITMEVNGEIVRDG